ncbi:MAG: GntR family transcriptional regulator [Brevinematales bacterium]
MFIRIDLTSDTPIYLQIKNEIIRGIATGELKVGDQLPTVRRLAEELGINLHTVNKAYNLLKREGFISLNRKRGAVVVERENRNKDMERLKQILTPIVNEYFCKNFTRDDFIKVIDEIYEDIEKQSNM